MKTIEELKNQIICGDCLDVMKGIPDKSIDYCVADFPYNISNNKHSTTKKGNNYVSGDFGNWDKWDNLEDFISWVFNVCKEIQRILKPQASCLLFFDNKQAGWIGCEMERLKIMVYKSPIIWVKNNPIPNLRKAGFRSSFEHGIWMINSQEQYAGNGNIVVKSKTFNFQSQQEMTNVMKYNIGQNLTEHPTEKPLELTKRFISIFTNENDIVLDLFSGSGTTAVACKQLNRNYIGIEISEKYCEIARQRLRQGILKLKNPKTYTF